VKFAKLICPNLGSFLCPLWVLLSGNDAQRIETLQVFEVYELKI
jgi:hypothetical protein